MIGTVGPWTYVAPPGPAALKPGPVPTMSVIVSAYNVAPYIGAALESALAQTAPALQVIVCDDGSTDDFEAAVAPYRERITLMRQTNRGPSAAKNAAAARATGDFVVVLDGDDIYHPRRLEAIGDLAAARPDLDIIATDGQILGQAGPAGTYHGTGTSFDAERPRQHILRHNYFLVPAMRRSLFESAGGFDESLRNADDWDLSLRLVFAGASVGLVDAPLMSYRKRPGQLTGQAVGLRYAEVRLLEKALREQELSADERRIALQTLARSRLLWARHAHLSGDPSARRAARAAARTRGLGWKTRSAYALRSLTG